MWSCLHRVPDSVIQCLCIQTSQNIKTTSNIVSTSLQNSSDDLQHCVFIVQNFSMRKKNLFPTCRIYCVHFPGAQRRHRAHESVASQALQQLQTPACNSLLSKSGLCKSNDFWLFEGQSCLFTNIHSVHRETSNNNIQQWGKYHSLFW